MSPSNSSSSSWPWSPHSRPMAVDSRHRVTTRCASLWRKAKSAALGKAKTVASSERDAGEPADHAHSGSADRSSDAAHPVANPPCETSPVACDFAEDPLATPPGQGVFGNLSSDCLEVVFRRLGDARDAVRASCVCKAWHSAFHGSTRHVSLQLDPVLLQWQPSFRPVYAAHLDTVTSALTPGIRSGSGRGGESGVAADGQFLASSGETSSRGGGWTGGRSIMSMGEVTSGGEGSGGVAGWWWDPMASGGWHVNHTDRFDCNSLARPGWMAHEPYHRSFSPDLIRALLQQFPNLTSACLPVTVRGSEATTEIQPVLIALASCSALCSLHVQVNAGRRANNPPLLLDLTAQVATLLPALPSLRALSLQSAHCFLRSSPPLLASFSRLHHLALPVLHLPAPLLALTRLSSVALAVLCPLCPALLASPAPFHRLTRLSSLALHLGASDDCHPCPMCTVTDTAHGSTSGSSSSHGSGGGAGGGSSASTAKPSTSLTALSPLTDLFSGLSPSLTSLTYSPPAFPPPAPTSLPASLITLTALRTLRLLAPTAATTAHFWGDLDGLSRLTQLTFLELSCVAGNAVPASLQGMPLLAHLVLPWAQSDPARVVPSLSALRELEIGTGALRIEPQVEAATAGRAGQAGQGAPGAATAESTPNPPTSNTLYAYALSEPCQPTATFAAPPVLLPPSLTSLRLLHTDHRPLHLPALACSSLRRLSFSFNVELAARVPPHACFFPNLQFLELFRVEGSFGWGNGQWLGAMPSLTHFISRCPKRNHSYLLHRLAPSLKFLHLEDPSPKVPLVVLPSLTSLTIDKYCDVSALLSSLAAFSALHTLRFNCFSQVAADRKLSPGRVGRPPALRVLQFRFAQIHALPEFFPAFHCLRVSGCSKLPPPPPSLVPLLVPAR
ncbi:unnamed protein product [Closterium sp. NIES-64]|nr:unnamed protein product [Closterium sp. NIES-64]CAI5996013.1 unnamed protein product [Closterium sp. NIES-64]